MSKYLKSIFIIILSLLVTTCDSGGDGGGGSGYSSSPSFDNQASNNTTGAPNEVVCTVKVNSRSFNETAFIAAVAEDLDCSTDDISVTSLTIADSVAYIAFIFTSNEDELLEDIQNALYDGDIGGFEAMIIIANMDEDIACYLGEDCAGICGGDTLEDPCGVCGGSSDCDGGNIAGLYQLYSMVSYDSGDSDTGYCSGTIEEQWTGPTFNISDNDNDDTDCSDCDCYYGTYQAEITIYVELNSNGEYRFFEQENESVDSYTECSGNCYDQGDCDCSTYSDDGREFNLETGTWSISNGVVSVAANSESEWEWGTESYQSTCYDNDEQVMNGCIDHYEYGGYEESDNIYEGFSNGFYLHDLDDDYGYVEDCERMEFRRISSWPSISGCTDPFADNYNSVATVDDGTCGAGVCYDNPAIGRRDKRKSFLSFSR